MRSLLLLTSLLAPLALAACGGADASPAPRTSAAPAATTAPDPAALAGCEALFARQRDCTDDYIPALVDLRISLDKPAGIAEAARTEGRDAIIAKAMEEWAQDSQPAAITATCQKILPTVPADQLAPMQAKASECMAKTACGEFSTCVVDMMSAHIASGH